MGHNRHTWNSGDVISASLLNSIESDLAAAAVIADVGAAGTATGDALRAAYGARGETAQSVAAALPNLMAAVRTYDDSTTPTLRILGFGSSVAVGATLPDPSTQAPVARFGARLAQTINALGNLHLATTNGSVNGSTATDFTASSAYANAKTAAGGTPTVALFCYGMNDGFTGAYHQGQTFPGFYAALKADVQAVLNDGGDAIIVTTPHPRCGMASSWDGAVAPVTYPASGTPIPAFTAAASVVTADWLGNGRPVAASYRHLRINQTMRAVAAELGVPLIDAERYWFAAVANYGESALFNTSEYAHPNLLGHQSSYWAAIDAFMVGLQTPPVSTAVPRPVQQVFAVKDSNATRTSTTTLTDDTQLTFPVGAGQVWTVEATINYAAGAGNLRVGLSHPTGTTGRISRVGSGVIGGPSHDAGAGRSNALPDTYGLPAGGNGADASVRVSALLRTTTAGNVTMQFCQDTADAGATVIYANSYLRATRIA